MLISLVVSLSLSLSLSATRLRLARSTPISLARVSAFSIGVLLASSFSEIAIAAARSRHGQDNTGKTNPLKILP